MSQTTEIEWADATWNPVRGCTKISAGCKFCYAERFAERFRGVPGHAFEQGFDLRLVPEALGLPLTWKKPKRIFVNSMSDLFHEDIPFEFISEVWDIMARAHWHTYMILTKRSKRMVAYFEWLKQGMKVRGLDEWWKGVDPLPQIWLGVTTENQMAADERVTDLLQCPAAVRFVSYEPALGPLDLTAIKQDLGEGLFGDALSWHHMPYNGGNKRPYPKIDWVICGGESGSGARPMHPDWARKLRDQCAEAGVPFFFKQHGEWAPGECADHPQTRTEQTAKLVNGQWVFGRQTPSQCASLHVDDQPDLYRFGKRKAGRKLDGIEHNDFPKPRAKV